MFNKIHEYFLMGATSLTFVLGEVSHAQEEYKPLVTIPGVNSAGNFSQYFNSLFDIAVLIGSILAVLMIAIGGVQYMTTDAVFQKKDAKSRIQMALAGLLMLLATFLFFNQIGGNEILKLKINLPKSSLQEGASQPTVPTSPGQNNIFSDPNG